MKEHFRFPLFLITLYLCSGFLCFLLPSPSQAGLYYQHSLFYNSTTDNADGFNYSTMKNVLFFGASLGKADKIILGQNVIFWNKTHKGTSASNESKISLLELGPRLTYYFNEARTFSVNIAYDPYVKGTRTLATSSDQEEISGSSIFLSAVYQLKVSKMFFIGASLNYHSVTISESTVSNVATEVSQTYTSIYPAIDFSIRFK